MREEKEADISDSDSDVDMITRLPDHLTLDNILQFLPTADAAAMSTVSKYWFNLWNSLTIWHFSFDETTQRLENLLPCVKDSLSSLRSPEENSIIHSFVLNMHFGKERLYDMNSLPYLCKVSNYIDIWINLVLKNNVKHLKIRISNMRCWLPTDLFSAKSFLTMNIEGCYIRSNLFFCRNYSSFNCLKELVLLRLKTSSYMVHKILFYSPLLEKVVLKEISIKDSLVVCNLPRLSYVEVEQALEGKLEIRAPNLSTLILHLYGSVKVLVSDSVTGRGNYGLKKFVFEHAMLETLQLCFNSCARIKVACSNLRTMSLSNKGSENPLDVNVDAPKLEQLDYEGYVIPSFYGMASLVKPTVTLKLSLGGLPGFDVAIRSCIEMFNQPTVHLSYLYGQFFKAQEILRTGQVQKMEFTSPPTKVKCLMWSLSSSTPSLAYRLLLDCSLCICHPSILRVEALPANWDFMKFLCHELLDREENPSCCKDEPEFRCWRHYLKSVNVQIQSQSETENPRTFRDKALILNHIDTSKEVQFNMNWSRDLV